MLTFIEYLNSYLTENESPIVLYHGGKHYVSKPNLGLTQQTDRGMYGKGFVNHALIVPSPIVRLQTLKRVMLGHIPALIP
jgi:hypothetical protein